MRLCSSSAASSITPWERERKKSQIPLATYISADLLETWANLSDDYPPKPSNDNTQPNSPEMFSLITQSLFSFFLFIHSYFLFTKLKRIEQEDSSNSWSQIRVHKVFEGKKLLRTMYLLKRRKFRKCGWKKIKWRSVIVAEKKVLLLKKL